MVLLLSVGPRVISKEVQGNGDHPSSGSEAGHQAWQHAGFQAGRQAGHQAQKHRRLRSRAWSQSQHRTRINKDFGAPVLFYGRFKPLFHKMQRHYHHHQRDQNLESFRKDHFAGVQNLI